MTAADALDRVSIDTAAVVRFLLHEPTRIARLMARHTPDRGRCYACSQRGVPWPCVPVTLAANAARQLDCAVIPFQRKATR